MIQSPLNVLVRTGVAGLRGALHRSSLDPFPGSCDVVTMMTWRAEQEGWEEKDLYCDVPFLVATHTLSSSTASSTNWRWTISSEIWSLDPKMMEWRVLDGIETIYGEDEMPATEESTGT